ncbi:MAG: hypothetical protein U0790_17825 [Isosphaeraceae bacterium]
MSARSTAGQLRLVERTLESTSDWVDQEIDRLEIRPSGRLEVHERVPAGDSRTCVYREAEGAAGEGPGRQAEVSRLLGEDRSGARSMARGRRRRERVAASLAAVAEGPQPWAAWGNLGINGRAAAR